MISHGGTGTTQKALAAGVPVCAVPFMRDQFEVARRVEHCLKWGAAEHVLPPQPKRARRYWPSSCV